MDNKILDKMNLVLDNCRKSQAEASDIDSRINPLRQQLFEWGKVEFK